jgi:hypothetical protein
VSHGIYAALEFDIFRIRTNHIVLPHKILVDQGASRVQRVFQIDDGCLVDEKPVLVSKLEVVIASWLSLNLLFSPQPKLNVQCQETVRIFWCKKTFLQVSRVYF